MTSASVQIPQDSTATLSTTFSTSTFLSDGGYDYELLGSDTDSRYECPICLLYLRDPVLTTCGHRFCERCISKWVIKEGGRCPVDGGILEYENIFPDNFTRREIMQCKAKCPFGKEGCSVILSLSDLEKHIQTAHTSGESNGVSGGILGKVNGSPAPTSNGMVECYYKEVGCVSYFPQENLQRHLELDMHHHLQLLTAAYRRLKLSRPQDLFLRQDSRDSTRWLLADDVMDSDEYQFRRQRSWDSVRFARQAYCRPRYHDRLAESDESLPKGKGSSELQLQKSSSHFQKAELSESTITNLNGNPVAVKDIFERLVRLEQSDREKQIKLDRLESQLSSALKLFSTVTRAMDDLTARYCGGIYVWKIQGFTKRCHDMRQNPALHLTSPGFYTGIFEYKLCLRFNLKTVPTVSCADGAVGGVSLDFPSLDKDDETFVSLNIHFMQGEFDDTLRWPFNGHIELQIIHPNSKQSIIETMKAKPDAIAFAKPTEAKNKTGFGYSDFCPISKIFSLGFVKGDTLVCKICVKAF